MNTHPSKLFTHILANTLIASIANNFLWFALVFWAYLETRSVLVTSLIWGVYLVASLVCGVFFGAIVDHNKKKNVMFWSTTLSFFWFLLAGIVFLSHEIQAFHSIYSPQLWLLITLILVGTIAGNIRMIALSTIVTILFEEWERDKANGSVWIANGIAFWIVSILSGIVIGQLGMGYAILMSIFVSLLVLIHLLLLSFPPEPILIENQHTKKSIDMRGTIRIVASISGLFGLIFFSMFNNFLGGVFMSLMDPYGLSLVSVEAWGLIWWILSFGFIIGGLLITKWWLGRNPLKTLLLVNVIMWSVCVFFTAYPSIILTTIGLFIFMSLHPYAEASEQTILQKVVPLERQWRVFGFAQSMEQGASPFTAFLIGPLAEFFVIPFMTTGSGVALFGSWFWSGQDRALALIFSIAGIIGLIVTLLAFLSRSYANLSKSCT